MEIFDNLKSNIIKLRGTVEKFKEDHKTISVAVTEIVDSLPKPFDMFGRVLWNGLEKKDNSAEELLHTLEKIEKNDELNFIKITAKIDELMACSPTKEDVLQISKNIKNSEETIIDILGNQIQELGNRISVDMARMVEVQKEMCQILREQNVSTTITHTTNLKIPFEIEEKIKQLEEEKCQLQKKLEDAGKQPKIDVDLLLRQSFFHYTEKEYEKALGLSEMALKIDPNNVRAMNNIGLALDDGIQDHAKALIIFDTAIKMRPRDGSLWFNRGRTLHNLERYEDSLANFTKAIEYNSDGPDVRYNMGITLTSLERYEESLESYAKAIEYNSNYGTAWNNKGSVYQNLERYDEALTCYENAIDNFVIPELYYSTTWRNKADTLASLERYEESLESYAKALEYVPNDSDIWTNKGATFHRFGQLDEAIKCFKKALEINPNNSLAKNNLKSAQDLNS